MGGVMSSIVVSGDTSGAITIAAPAVSGTNTLTLPASTGTLLTTGSPQSGGIIQVVQATFAGLISSASATLTDTGLTASITPKFATSKILVLVNMNCCGKTANTNADFQLLRGATSIFKMGDIVGYTNSTLPINIGSVDGVYLDSPATTSSTTYKTKYANVLATGAVYMNFYYNNDTTTSSITLLEVAA